jgi:subtilisin family serine protease
VSRLRVAALAALSCVVALGMPASAAPVPDFEMIRADGAPAAPAAAARASATPATGRLVVEFTGAPDLGRKPGPGSWGSRGSSVARSLQTQAQSTQAPARNLLASRPAVRATSFWIRNTMVVEGADAALATQLRGLPGVRAVRAERTYKLGPVLAPKQVMDLAAADPAWGVAQVGADRAWDRGAMGGGVVVATIDSGVDYKHPAIVNQYRGRQADGTFDHNYNWLDAARDCPTSDPCDRYGHGTHTMGTILGGDGPGPFTPDTGVAPAAQWISVGCGPNFCTESELLTGGQFIVAPTDLSGANPDPARRPDIVSNSWGVPSDPTIVDMVAAWRAAGIIPVFSNGNEGPACGTATPPGNFAETFSAGATDRQDVIAPFSSRGPSATSGAGKPDVSAPGVDVVSAVPGGGYGAMSGTSMAAPHVAGELALMLGAAPRLRGDIEGATAVVARTAMDIVDRTCGGDSDGDPNNVYGEGRIDADAAVAVVAVGGTVAGTITDRATGRPISGARVRLDGAERPASAVTDPTGRFSVLVAEGTYTATVEALGYEPASRAGVVVTRDQTTTIEVSLAPAPRVAIRGRVTGLERNEPLAGARVLVQGSGVPAVTTEPDGTYTVTVPAGTYAVEASLGGCVTKQTVEVVARADTRADFQLGARTDRFGHGCGPTTMRWVDAQTPTTLYGDEAYGRLRLPFAFPYYGRTYQSVYLTTNGVLSFIDPIYASGFHEAIPAVWQPNAAIYALWQDLILDDDADVTYDVTTGGTGGGRVVISYNRMRLLGGDGRVTFQVHLYADGTIDLLYDDVAAAGDGAGATIGIEDHDGTDALQFGFNEANAPSHTAWRYRVVATSAVTGAVLDANDGRPIPGATVTANPGGRSVTTDAQGRYRLALIPGPYRLTATAKNYETGSVDVVGEAGTALEAPPLRLKAPVGAVAPPALDLTMPAGSAAPPSATVTVKNTGSAPMSFEALSHLPAPASATAPAPAVVPRSAAARARRPWDTPTGAAPTGNPAMAPQAARTKPVITDPEGDAPGPDIVGVDAGADEEVATFSIRYAPGTQFAGFGGYLLLDTDQNPNTGWPATELYGKPSQDVGFEYFATLSRSATPGGSVPVFRTSDEALVGTVAARFDGTTTTMDLPLSLFGAGEEGDINVAVVVGVGGASEWAPDVGHGTVTNRFEAPWLKAQPTSGIVPVGGSVPLRVTAGAPDLLPGVHRAELWVAINDPRQSRIVVPVTLRVTVPAGHGAFHGTVTDARGGTPIAGATVTVTAGPAGTPFRLATVTDAQGRYALYAPAGPASVRIEADGYLPSDQTVAVVVGADPVLDAALVPRESVAVVEGGPVQLTVPPGGTGSGRLTVRNEGVVDLTVAVRERAVAPVAAPSAPARLLSRGQPVTLRGNGGDRVVTPSSWQWSPAAAAPARKVLVYADDPVHVAPDTHVDRALRRLGLPYTAHYNGDFAGFKANLDKGGWDLVVLANDNVEMTADVLGALQSYVAGGGRLAAHSWLVGFSPHQLWSTLGVGSVVDDRDPPDPVRWWDPGHAAVTVPEQVPELTTLTAETYSIYGQHVTTLPGFEAVAGYTAAPAPGEAALVIGNGGRTAFRGFLDGHNSADLDADGQPDGVELWVNLIEGLTTAFVTDVPWLQVQPAATTVAPGASTELVVKVDASALAPGRHEAELFVLTNDPRNRVIKVPVRVEVATTTTTTTTTTTSTTTTTTKTRPTRSSTTTTTRTRPTRSTTSRTTKTTRSTRPPT